MSRSEARAAGTTLEETGVVGTAAEARSAQALPPLQSILIVFPDMPIAEEVREAYNKDGFKIIGDGVNPISFEEISNEISGRIDKNTVINLYGHGITNYGEHVINIGNESGHLVPTQSLLQAFTSIAPSVSQEDSSQKVPMQIHLFSCYGGAAATNVGVLPEGSVLIAHAPEDNYSLIKNNNASIANLANVGTGKVLHDLMINYIYEMQNITVAIRLPEGRFTQFTLRPPSHDVARADTITRYINEACNGIKAHLGSEDIGSLPALVNLDDIPTPKEIAASVEARLDDYQKESISTKVFFAKTEADYSELQSFIKATGKNPDEFLYSSDPLGLRDISLLSMVSEQPNVSLTKDLIKSLIETGADPNKLDKNGKSPLSYSGSKEVAIELLKNGAKLTKENLEHLKARGIDLQKKDEYGNTLLHHADDVKLTKAFIDAGFDVNAKADGYGFTPLHMAKSPDIARVLLENGADSRSLCEGYGAPFGMAQTSEIAKTIILYSGAEEDNQIHKQQIDRLIEDTKDQAMGKSPFENPDVMKAVYEAGKDSSGSTPLHFARSEEAINGLLELGANLTAENKEKKTALDYARERGDAVIVELLSRKMAEIEAKNAVLGASRAKVVDQPLDDKAKAASMIQRFLRQTATKIRHDDSGVMAKGASASKASQGFGKNV